ncbi:Scube1 [Symbiodinium microadriaticum]|nr:Scube1 [Symbiodinium microadriaticum]CAE7939260.1 Scube1 [Symbiodinium sp. KB8]
MSFGNLPADADLESIRNQLVAMFLATFSASARVDPSAIEIDFVGLGLAGRRLRRLFDASTIVITIKQRTADEASAIAADMDAVTVTNEVAAAVQQNPTLSGAGISLEVESAPAVSSTVVSCSPRMSVPPGVPVLSADDCQCSPGYSYDTVAQGCEPCARGEYKDAISMDACTRCPSEKSTLEVGATSPEQCRCEAGLFADGSGFCSSCEIGFYCPGTGEAVSCPQNSTTVAPGGRTATDCICLPGYRKGATSCQACEPGTYKPTVGNDATCALECPANSMSDFASTSLADCFCLPRFHAILDNAFDQGSLARCAGCNYQGLECRGGFENETNGTERRHAQPVAEPGFYQAGLSTARECDVLLPDGSSACKGGANCVAQRMDLPVPQSCNGMLGNECAEGSTGVLCGECPDHWARDDYPELCRKCPPDSAGDLSFAVLSDIGQKVFLNFVVAAMAATAAVKGSAKLHTSMIRLGTQWMAACSVLTQFNLERLPGFEWSQQDAEMAMLAACAESNATSCEAGAQAATFPWPEEVSSAMSDLFAIMSLVPRLATVQFASKCRAGELLPGSRAATMAAPGIYFVTSPILAIIGLFLFAAFMVYLVVPIAALAGLYFNDFQRDKKKRDKLKIQAREAFDALAEEHRHGLVWTDLQDSGILDEVELNIFEHGIDHMESFISGFHDWGSCSAEAKRPILAKLCVHKASQDPRQEQLRAEVRLTMEEFKTMPDFSTKGHGERGLLEILFDKSWRGKNSSIFSDLGEPPAALHDFVRRALAWKLRHRVEHRAADWGLDVGTVALAVCDSFSTARELHVSSADESGFDELIAKTCERLSLERQRRHEKDTEIRAPEPIASGLDPDTLDFGLFTSRPRPSQLLQQCVPVIWVMLLAMWPELLSQFLKMVWCAPFSEDNNRGLTEVKQRLLPHPDVVCWSFDHFELALIASIGLVVWCIGVPLLLFLRIYKLKDRQNPENGRRYGFFIEGYEPGFWYWDIIVKRFDIALMNLVTYTSLADDEKAKLLLFPFISGAMLAIAAWCRPFTNDQAEILDFMEMCLLSFRFVMFSMIAVLLIFNPSAAVTYAVAGTLVLALGCICMYFALHVMVQMLRTSAEEMGEEVEEDDDSNDHARDAKTTQNPKDKGKGKPNPIVVLVGEVKKTLIGCTLPLFVQGEDEKLFVEWTITTDKIRLVSSQPKKLRRSSSFARVASAVKHARAQILRFGASYQRQVVVKALEEFSELWFDQFDQLVMPVDSTRLLVALTSTLRNLPNKTPKRQIASKWKEEVDKLFMPRADGQQGLHGIDNKWHVTPDEILVMTQRLASVGAKDAVILVESVLSALHRRQKEYAVYMRELEIEDEDESDQEGFGPPFALEEDSNQANEYPDGVQLVPRRNVPMAERAAQTKMSGMKRSQDARDVLEIARVQELAPAAEAGSTLLDAKVEKSSALVSSGRSRSPSPAEERQSSASPFPDTEVKSVVPMTIDAPNQTAL